MGIVHPIALRAWRVVSCPRWRVLSRCPLVRGAEGPVDVLRLGSVELQPVQSTAAWRHERRTSPQMKEVCRHGSDDAFESPSTRGPPLQPTAMWHARTASPARTEAAAEC
ncbi:hypothetical protein GCM10010532_026080 [Dactylosporangium siamense]|uniref:Uncharacterized protein n=1 Tax=Dactylosporangium siamense TaxID=685454 RepID=A0A919PZ88_9ACTN|nr:hypothetical protein Dsi01nite_090610 [Dactylosporangium siamense]